MGNLFLTILAVVGSCVFLTIFVGQVIIVYRYMREKQTLWGIINPMEAFLWAWRDTENHTILRWIAIINLVWCLIGLVALVIAIIVFEI
jgi:hypothetical protein